MEIWCIWLCIGVIFFIIEILTPVLFFMNFALASLLCAVLAYFKVSFLWQVIAFAISSLIFLLILRPILTKSMNKNVAENEIENSYIGKTAKAVEEINQNEGKILIYGEIWMAKSVDENVIPKDSEVKIIKNDSAIMYVEKIM